MPPDEQRSSRRRALLVATASYSDPGLAALRAPTGDVAALAAVLGDTEIGGFEVQQLIDRPTEELRKEIETFFDEGRPQDLLLLYVSGHGVLSQSRRFYFATASTSLKLLRSTAIEDSFVNDVMQGSRARSIVLVLDCCHSGAFGKGLAPKSAMTVDVEHRFEGQGRVTLSASTELEYAFEESAINELEPAAPGSVFTGSVVEGLRSGDADIDEDGRVSVDDLYDYVCRRVRERAAHQTPGMAGDVRGQIVLAKSARRAALPPELARAIESNLVGIRAGAVDELKALMRAGGTEAAGARAALETLAEDDSRRVAAAALVALGRSPPAAETETEPEPEAESGPPPAPVAPRPTRRRPRRGVIWAVLALAGLVVIVAVLAAVLGDGNGESSGPSLGTPYDFESSGNQQVVAAPLKATNAEVMIVGGDQPQAISSAAAGVPEAGAKQSFGTGIASADFDGDGQADVAVGTPDLNVVGVLYGAGDGDFKDPPARFTGKGDFARYGYALLARDLNNDNYADLVVGAPGAGNDVRYHAGAIRIIFGGAKGLTMKGARVLTPPPGADNNFGLVLSAGKIDEGETVDLVEGAPDAAGHLTFCRGGADGPVSCRTLPPFGQDNGTSALAVADLDTDGHDDVIQGDANIGPGDDDPGGLRLWKGGSSGPANTPTATVNPKSLGLPAAFGSVSAGFGLTVDAGKLDGDQYPDIAVGAPGFQKGDGAVILIRGGPKLVADNQNLEAQSGVDGERLGSDLALLYLESSDTATLVTVSENADLAQSVKVLKGADLIALPGLDKLATGIAEDLKLGRNAGAD